jgi:GTPase SAR1 family protein
LTALLAYVTLLLKITLRVNLMAADPGKFSGNIHSFHANSNHRLSPWIDVIGANADPVRHYRGVGKTCLIHRIIRGTYIEPAPMIDAYGLGKPIPPGKIHLRDNSVANIEERRFQAFRHIDIVLCCYDVTDEKSFRFIADNFHNIRTEAHVTSARLIIVATKCDEPEEKRKVSTEMGKALAAEKEVSHVETSAKTGMGCEELINIFLPYRAEYLRIQEEENAKKAEAVQNNRRCIIS